MKAKTITILKSKKIAALIAYITTILSSVTSFVLIPVCLKYVGSEQYGLYQKVYAVAQYLMIVDLGLSSTVVRYAVSARTRNDLFEERRVYGFMLKISAALNLVLVFLGFLFYQYIDVIYLSMSDIEMRKAKQLLVMMIIHSSFLVFLDCAIGTVATYEHFVFSKSQRLFRTTLRLILIPLFITITRDIATIAFVDLVLIIITFLSTLFYNYFILHARISFKPMEKEVAKGAFSLMFTCLLQNTSKFLNNGIDKILLGRYLGNNAVTTYSIAMTFISFYMIFSTVIQNIHLPQIVKMNTEGATISAMTNVVVRVGRIQMVLCGGFLCGFIVLGKEFISVWAGAEHITAWYIALIIMIPLIIPLTQNVCLCILTAKDKRLFRSVVAVALSIANFILTIILIKKIGLIGAPIGTAIAYLLGYVIAMNVYYSRVLGIHVIKMFLQIWNRILPCLLIAGVSCFFIFQAIPSSNHILGWALKALLFLAIYGGTLIVYGFNSREKKTIKKYIKNLIP